MGWCGKNGEAANTSAFQGRYKTGCTRKRWREIVILTAERWERVSSTPLLVRSANSQFHHHSDSNSGWLVVDMRNIMVLEEAGIYLERVQ